MVDLTGLAGSLAIAALTSALLVLLGRLPWKNPNPTRVSLGWVLGVGLGFVAGYLVLGMRPKWPPLEEWDRFLLLLLPAVLLVEIVGAFRAIPEWVLVAFRFLVALGAGRVLLHNTTYITDLSGPGSAEWTPTQTWLVLGALAVALAGVWLALAFLAQRTPSRSLPLGLAMVSVGSSLAVMLSGIATAQMGVPLAGALIGASVVSPPPNTLSRPGSMLGVALVCLFTLVLSGRFFGELSTLNAVMLFLAPLLCWLPELPYLHRLRPSLRGFAGAFLAGTLTIGVVLSAKQTHSEDSRPPNTAEPSSQDYESFGK